MTTATALRVCAIVYLIVIVVDLLKSRRYKRFAAEVLLLLGLLFVDVLLTNATIGHVAFGADLAALPVILTMFVAVLCGIAARYVFYLRGKFSWLDCLKPLCVSPVVLLPLISSVQVAKDLQPIQIVSFALLAFQNGFFWQTVFERARPRRSP
jgi:hypothetical protein